MDTSSIRDIGKQNKAVREALDNMVREHGIMYAAIARQLLVLPSNFHHWRKRRYYYGIGNLAKVETIIRCYQF